MTHAAMSGYGFRVPGFGLKSADPSSLRLCSLLSLLASSLLLSGCGTSQKPEALEPPAAASFRAFDHPSDDGQTINLEWARCPSEAPDVFYLSLIHI